MKKDCYDGSPFMTTIPLIRSSWEFFRKQPALVSVCAWLLFLPMLCTDGLNALAEGKILPGAVTEEGRMAVAVLILLFGVLSIWGHCSVLVTGKRMLQTKAGRSRTSFRATASQSKAFIIPFLLTNLLRGCVAALWMLPFFALFFFVFAAASLANGHEPSKPLYILMLAIFSLPAMAYLLRTVFTPVIVVGENIAYRAALKRSKEAVRGNFWAIAGQLVLILILLFAIPMSLISAAALTLPSELAISHAVVSVASNAWIAVATILLNLCLIQMYEQVRTPLNR